MSHQRLHALLICAITSLLPATRFAAAPSSGDLKAGKLVYQRYCVSCHGELGNGRGEAAESMSVKPRDYRQGTFKWRSTPSGSLPTDSDLERTLEHGLYGTYMPSWKWLDARSRRDVIAYIKTFSPRFNTERPEEPILISADPGYTASSVARGAAIYKKFNCSQCHGSTGQGDGPSARELKDDWGNPTLPSDLTTGRLRAGDASADIYRVFMSGLSGSAMPGYADSLNSEEAWDLVHFIQSLSPLYPRVVVSRPE
jgi:cytochrome c oxidase cbb3-type subunit 2